MTPTAAVPFPLALATTGPSADGALTSGHGLTFLAGLAAGALVVAAVAFLRRRARRREAASLARAIDALGRRGSDDARNAELTAIAAIETGAGLEPIAASIRRTARSLLEQESTLATRLRELEAVLHSTTNGFLALDQQHRVLDLNKAGAAMLGVRGADVRGRLLPEIARHPALLRFVDEALERGNACEETLTLSHDDSAHVHATAEPLRDSNGRAVGLLVSLHDVTRLKRLESLRSDFVANVSHELRTPITAIKGYVETLLQVAEEDPSRVRRFLEIVQRNTSRLSHLVEDLLSLASLEQLEQDVRPSVSLVDVPGASIVQDVIEQLSPQAEARGIALEARIAAPLSLRADKVLVEQALANLVANAIRYGPERATVTIGLAPDPSARMAVISVRDQGPGIPPVHLERIFERFYRVDRARTRRAGDASSGTGLGLAIVKHIAQLHGGRVEVDSEVGVGSEFRLRLPLAEAASHPQ
ncbi:MAG: PAS domain-containing protein [Phycisphaerae bacterium]|nr:PAS domain-containing protein [Phycisphaerae bacterium]